MDHLRLERDTAPFHTILGYILRIFGEPIVLAFKTCVAVVDEARRRVIPTPALRRLVEQIYRPLIEGLEHAITMWVANGDYPTFDTLLSTARIAMAWEHLCFNMSMAQLAPPSAAAHGTARANGAQGRATRGESSQRSGAISKRSQRSGSGGSSAKGGGGSDSGGGRGRGASSGGRGQAGGQTRGSNPKPKSKLALAGGDHTSRDPRLRAFRSEQGKHLPPHAPDDKKACAFYAVWGWCPLDRCTHQHELPAWFDRDAFLACHRS
jgi:hypothetical protein